MKASGLAPGPGAIGVDKMERHAKLATAVALFVAVASALVVIPTMDTADADTGGLEVPEISDEYLIGSDFDWTSIEEGQNYKIISEIVITTNDNGASIPETTTIYILNGGELTFEDCTVMIAGNIVVQNGGTLTISSTGLTLNGGIVAMAGSTVHLKIDSIGQNYDFVAPEASDSTIFTLASGFISITETLNGYEEETYKFTIDGVATFDMIELSGGVVSYEVVIPEGGELSVVDDLAEEGVITNDGTLIVADGVTVDHSGYGFVNNGTFVNNGILNVQYDEIQNKGSIVNNGVIALDDVAIDNEGSISGNGICQGSITGEGTILSGIFTVDVTDMCADGKAAYLYNDLYVVGAENEASAAIVIDNIPFAELADVLMLVNAESVVASVEEDILMLLDDFQVGGAKVTIPAGSDITIDLNGNDIVFDVVDVAGKLTLTDDTETKGTVACTSFNVNGGTLIGDVLVGSASGDALVYVNSSGTVSGLGFNITDMTGGAVTVNPGATGAVVVSDTIVLVGGPESVVDRGIYVNQTAEGGSVTIEDVVFNFNGNDACPVNVDINSTSVVKVSDLTYNDCARPNKFLVNATTDVTVGSEGNLDFDHAGDAVFWDAADEGNTFTVAGELVVDGLLTVTSGGHLVVPDDADMVVNGSIVVTSDASVTGGLVFGSDRANSIDLSEVVAGDSGLRLSLGSVVISGSVVSGTMVLNGNGIIDGDVDMGAAVLEVPKDSSLVIPADASISGTAAMKVAGAVSVFGSVATPIQNSGAVNVYEGGKVTGEVTGTDVVDVDEIVVAIQPIKDVTIKLGKDMRIAVSVIPADARITAAIGETPLDVDGRTISWTPDKTGTYTVTVTAEYDGQVDTESFKVIVTETAADEEDDPIDWRLVVIAVILAIMVIALLVRFV